MWMSVSNSRPGRAAALAAAGLWAAVIFGFSAMPGSDVPGRFGPLAHFVEYAILSALLRLSMPPRCAGGTILAICAASAYGVTDELHQAFVPGRIPDHADWLLDTAGAALGALSAALVVRAHQARRRQ